MTEDDLPAASALAAAALGIDVEDADSARRWDARMAHPLSVAPAGCLVAEAGDEIIGVSQALTRGRLWLLSMLAVRADHRGAGVGTALLARALESARAYESRLILSSADPRALTAYARAGFALRPALATIGSVTPGALEAPDPVIRFGDASDLAALAPISIALRGGEHTPELHYFLAQGSRLLVHPDGGWAMVTPGQAVRVLAARTRETATALLTAALHLVGDAEGPVRWLTAEQDWAIALVVRAGLKLAGHGAICVQGTPGPLAPYIPSGAFG